MIKVSGMNCINCEKKVKNALKNLGLKRVKIELSTGVISFKNKKNIPQEVIEEKIKELGYEVV